MNVCMNASTPTFSRPRRSSFYRQRGGFDGQRGGFDRQRGGFDGQRGGFAVGLVIGLLIGLGLALGVALYVTKVPIPFLNKVPQRTAVQDAAEAEKNRNWDPNSPLYGKNPARPSAAASNVLAPPPGALPQTGKPPPVAVGVPPTGPVTAPTAAPAPVARASAPASARDPAAILADRPATKPPSSGGAGTDPDPFRYFVQAGAYSRTEDADQQRANLGMLGLEGRITEREQSGRTVYRVRVGPFENKADADAAKGKVAAAGVEAQLVRVQR